MSNAQLAFPLLPLRFYFMKIPQFVLASASPARRRLLQTVGIEPIVCPSDFDESQIQLQRSCTIGANFGSVQSRNCSPSVSISFDYGL